MMSSSECLNTEREKANLICLVKLTLNTLIDQSSSATALPVLDDRNNDVTNFILTLERVLNFRMKANWLVERRFFWDFVRPACIGSSRHSIIERVDEVSKNQNIKNKGRIWIKFALMEKKLSELLKLVISDCHLVRKYYHDDSIMISSQAFILCDQLAGLSAIDFSFCFKQDGSILAPPSSQSSDIDVIDLTPYLCYKSKTYRQLLKEQNNDEENKHPSPILPNNNELKPLNPTDREMVSLEKYKLEVEQRKYFEELLRHRDRELQQFKSRYDTLKNERDREVAVMENIILELQLQLGSVRNEVELKRKKSQQAGSTTPTKSLFTFGTRKSNSPPTPTNENLDDSHDTQMRPVEATLIIEENPDEQFHSNDFICPPSQTSRRSSHSTTTTNTEDDQYELVHQLNIETNNEQTSMNNDLKVTSSPELLSSATSLSSAPLSDDEESQQDKDSTSTHQDQKPVIHESGHFETVEITSEQVNALEEASATT